MSSLHLHPAVSWMHGEGAKAEPLRPSLLLLSAAYVVLTLIWWRGGPVVRDEPATPFVAQEAVQSVAAGDLRIFSRISGPDSLAGEFFYFAATGQDLAVYMRDRFGIDCNLPGNGDLRRGFDFCVKRHLALFYCDYLTQGGTAARPFPAAACEAIGLEYAAAGKKVGGGAGGAQGTVFLRELHYNGQSLDYLVKKFKERSPPKPIQERKGPARLVFVSEDPRNARRTDPGPFHRELDAYARLPPSPFFVAPVCFWQKESAILYPFYGAGDMIPLGDDEDVIDAVQPAAFQRIAKQLIEAVYLMHRAGITHMDIKPENIVIGGKDKQARLDFFLGHGPKQPRIMLIDFGLCIREADFRGLGCLKAGTKVTMSPEQLMCHRPLSPAADWWGVAATLWRLRVMWDSELDDEAKEALLSARDPHWQHSVITKTDAFGADFNELLEVMLQLYPEHRQFDQDIDKLYSLKFLQS